MFDECACVNQAVRALHWYLNNLIDFREGVTSVIIMCVPNTTRISK